MLRELDRGEASRPESDRQLEALHAHVSNSGTKITCFYSCFFLNQPCICLFMCFQLCATVHRVDRVRLARRGHHVHCEHALDVRLQQTSRSKRFLLLLLFHTVKNASNSLNALFVVETILGCQQKSPSCAQGVH